MIGFLGFEFTFWNIVLGIIAFAIAGAIVKRMDGWPNWTIIPIGILVFWLLPVVWCVAGFIVKVILVLILILGMAVIITQYLKTQRRKSGD